MVDLATGLLEGLCHAGHAALNLGHYLLLLAIHADQLDLHGLEFRRVIAHILSDLHGAELGPAHGAEVGHLAGLLRQGLVVVGASGVGVEGQIELILPAKLESSLGHGVVADLGARVTLGQIGGVGGDLVGNQPLLHILLVGQPQVLLGGDVAEHGAAVPADERGANAGGEVIVPRRDVGGERAQGIERRLVAMLQLLGHVALDHVHRHVTRPLDHHLHVVLPRNFGQLTQSAQLGELSLVVGVIDGARTQTVAQRQRHVIGGADLADFAKVLVKEVLLVVGEAPLGHDAATAGDDAGEALGGHRDEAQQDAGVDGEVVHPLLGLFEQGVAEQLPGEVFGDAVGLLQRLIDGHGTDGHRAVAQDPLAGLVDVAAGGEIDDCVGAPTGGPDQLLHLLFDAGGDRRVADVGVDLHQEIAADDHRLRFRVVDVAGDDGATGGHLITHKFGGDVLGKRAPKSRPGCWVRNSSERTRSRPMFSRMAINSISGVTMPARA